VKQQVEEFLTRLTKTQRTAVTSYQRIYSKNVEMLGRLDPAEQRKLVQHKFTKVELETLVADSVHHP